MHTKSKVYSIDELNEISERIAADNTKVDTGARLCATISGLALVLVWLVFWLGC